MSAVKERYLSYGANLGFVRLYCGACKSETLHRSQLCIHCGTAATIVQRANAMSAQQQYKDGLQLRRRRA
jgi:hypothetical protein